jgi:hypothetical protein
MKALKISGRTTPAKMISSSTRMNTSKKAEQIGSAFFIF